MFLAYTMVVWGSNPYGVIYIVRINPLINPLTTSNTILYIGIFKHVKYISMQTVLKKHSLRKRMFQNYKNISKKCFLVADSVYHKQMVFAIKILLSLKKRKLYFWRYNVDYCVCSIRKTFPEVIVKILKSMFKKIFKKNSFETIKPTVSL